MTDKQNFEKDINVPSKEIEYLDDAKECGYCSSLNDCCYCKNLACYELEEQLDQLKTEKEELNNIITNLENITDEFSAKINQLRVENEKLEKAVDDLLHKPEIQDKIHWKIDNEALLGSKDAWIYRLEKTLNEIKKICKMTLCNSLYCSLNYDHSKDFECEKTSCDSAKRRRFILEILQKISEVKNG